MTAEHRHPHDPERDRRPRDHQPTRGASAALEEPTRAAFGWVAVILAGVAVAALAFATFTGGGDRDIPAQGFYPEAEAYEREAHLEGQARTHAGATSASPGVSSEGDPSDGEFLPDSRHVPTS